MCVSGGDGKDVNVLCRYWHGWCMLNAPQNMGWSWDCEVPWSCSNAHSHYPAYYQPLWSFILYGCPVAKVVYILSCWSARLAVLRKWLYEGMQNLCRCVMRDAMREACFSTNACSQNVWTMSRRTNAKLNRRFCGKIGLALEAWNEHTEKHVPQFLGREF